VIIFFFFHGFIMCLYLRFLWPLCFVLFILSFYYKSLFNEFGGLSFFVNLVFSF